MESVGHPESQTAYLGQLLNVFWWMAFAFAFFFLAAFAFSGAQRVAATGAVVFAFAISARVARWRLERGDKQSAVMTVCAAILCADLAVLALQPTLFPTLTIAPLVCVGVALPYANKLVLKLLIVGAWLAVVVAAVTGASILASVSGDQLTRIPGERFSLPGVVFVATTLPAATALLLLVLWQFRSRLMSSLAQARKAEERLSYQATHDSLTGLPNRSLLNERLSRALKEAAAEAGRPFAVLFLDLDRFKYVNDSLGHSTGDELLREVAARLRLCLRPDDTIARMGGNEFVIFLEGFSIQNAESLALRVQEAFREPFRFHGHELYASASIGIVASDGMYSSPEELLRDADTAMYQAKKSGKARHAVFGAKMRRQAVSLLRLETDLRNGVEREEFVVYYQPIIWLASGGVSGFEALARWNHPERGLLAPDAFIKLAEETGLIHQIDRFVLEEACRQTAYWRTNLDGLFPPTISVNLSPSGLLRPDLVDEVARVLEATNLPGYALVIELTEAAIMEDPEESASVFKRLRSFGVRLHVDDFGTGYSSLEILNRLPVDALKIDRSFVSGAGQGEDVEIVRTILTMAHALGMDVIAEGVETDAHLNRLKQMGCDYVQGYRFSKPVHPDKARAILAAEPVW